MIYRQEIKIFDIINNVNFKIAFMIFSFFNINYYCNTKINSVLSMIFNTWFVGVNSESNVIVLFTY